MSTSSNLINNHQVVIGPISSSHWYTMRELREGVRDFQRENVNGCYDYNIELHHQTLKQMIGEIFK